MCPLRGHSPDNEQCTCQHYDEDGEEDYEPDPDCPVRGHDREVVSVSWSPDGTRLASGSDDKTVRIWEVATGKELSQLRGHSAVVRSVCFSSDGKQLTSGSDDKTVRNWDLATRASLS